MLVWYSLESSCPVCGHRLKLRELGGGFALGQDSDLLVRMEGRHLVQAAVHTCLRCRFSGYSEDFGANLPRSMVQRFLSEVTPKLTGAPSGTLQATPLPDVQYYWAFRCAAFLARSEAELGQRLLRAYWCLRLSPSSDLPAAEAAERRKLYLTGAIHHLRQDHRGKNDPVVLYLLGELNRKCGEFPTAVGYFKRFLDGTSAAGTPEPAAATKKGGAAGRPAAPKYLRLAAMKLLRAAEHGDARDRTMEEIVYADSTE